MNAGAVGAGVAGAGGSEVSLTELERAAAAAEGEGEGSQTDGTAAREEDAGGYDLLDEGEVPKLLARFKVNAVEGVGHRTQRGHPNPQANPCHLL